jgi:hypothetical protein
MDNKYIDRIDEIDTKLFALLKVGKYEHLRQLQEGKLRFRHLEYYKKIEGEKEPFHDDHEGLISIMQADSVQLMISVPGKPPHTISASTGLVGQVTINVKKTASVLCLFAVHLENWPEREFTEDEKKIYEAQLQLTDAVKEFGDSVWVITKSDVFLDRVRAACDKSKLPLRGGLVKYVERSKFHGFIPDHLIGYVKLSTFSKQREYRFLLDCAEPLPDPFVLDVGSLEDASIITPVDDFRMQIGLQE